MAEESPSTIHGIAEHHTYQSPNTDLTARTEHEPKPCYLSHAKCRKHQTRARAEERLRCVCHAQPGDENHRDIHKRNAKCLRHKLRPDGWDGDARDEPDGET